MSQNYDIDAILKSHYSSYENIELEQAQKNETISLAIGKFSRKVAAQPAKKNGSSFFAGFIRPAVAGAFAIIVVAALIYVFTQGDAVDPTGAAVSLRDSQLDTPKLMNSSPDKAASNESGIFTVDKTFNYEKSAKSSFERNLLNSTEKFGGKPEKIASDLFKTPTIRSDKGFEYYVQIEMIDADKAIMRVVCVEAEDADAAKRSLTELADIIEKDAGK